MAETSKPRLDSLEVIAAPMGEPIPAYWSPGVIGCQNYGCRYPDERRQCPECRWPTSWNKFRARPAYEVGEEIAFTRRNPWWKFWLPREVRETAIVRRVWLDKDGTHVEAD